MDDPSLASLSNIHPSTDNLTGFSTVAGRPTYREDRASYQDDVDSRSGGMSLDSERTKVGEADEEVKGFKRYSAPSQYVQARKVDEVAQQGSTQPGDGSEVRRDAAGNLYGPSSREVPFKERVVGVAQVTRGKVFGKPELQEHGEAILDGRTTHAEDKKR